MFIITNLNHSRPLGEIMIKMSTCCLAQSTSSLTDDEVNLPTYLDKVIDWPLTMLSSCYDVHKSDSGGSGLVNKWLWTWSEGAVGQRVWKFILKSSPLSQCLEFWMSMTHYMLFTQKNIGLIVNTAMTHQERVEYCSLYASGYNSRSH